MLFLLKNYYLKISLYLGIPLKSLKVIDEAIFFDIIFKSVLTCSTEDEKRGE